MAEKPRRRSKLQGTHPAEFHQEESRSDEPREAEAAAEQHPSPESPAAATSGKVRSLPPPTSRNPRRLSPAEKPRDDDMVSFNCKMRRDLRRAVAHLAADLEVDKQDVVADALSEYLASRGVDIPDDLQRPG